VPYDVPLWREVTVHPDHHVSVQYALYSAPSTTCPPGTQLEARCDRALVKLYRRGELVKVHPRQPKGGRAADADYPPERTAYAMRAPDRMVQQAVKVGPNVGHFAAGCWTEPFRAKLRQGQTLLRLAERYTAERLDAACARALGFDLLEVRRIERILVLALDHEGQPTPPPEQRVQRLPIGRFARPGTAERYACTVALLEAPTARALVQDDEVLEGLAVLNLARWRRNAVLGEPQEAVQRVGRRVDRGERHDGDAARCARRASMMRLRWVASMSISKASSGSVKATCR
jgi:hypothetical protein